MNALVGVLSVLFAITTSMAAGEYFPNGSVSGFEQEWYGKALRAMREPVLSQEHTNKTYFAFRILYLPTWGHPVCVRYWNDGTNFFRRSVMLSGAGGYEPGTIQKDSQVEVRKEEIEELFANLEKMRFWAVSPKDEIRGMDGSELILEGVREQKYKVVVHWTPDYQAKQRGLEAAVSFYQNLFERVGLLEKPAGKELK